MSMHACAHVARRQRGFERTYSPGQNEDVISARRRVCAHVERRHARAHAGAHARMSRGGGARKGRVHTCDAVLHRSRKIHRILHDRVIVTNDWSLLVASETIVDHNMLHNLRNLQHAARWEKIKLS